MSSSLPGISKLPKYKASIMKHILSQLKTHSAMTLLQQESQSSVSGLSSVSTTVGKVAYAELQRYLKVVQAMTVHSVDIRNVNYVRVLLAKEAGKTVPYNQFLRMCQTTLKIKDFEETDVCRLMREVLAVAAEEDNTQSSTVIGASEEVSIAKFNLLADLYHYFPMVRKKEANISTELYYVLSSNKRGQPQHPGV